MKLRHTLAAVLTVWLLAPAVAAGQDDGIVVDPDSPSAKEYEIPTDRARREAGGGSDEVNPSGDSDAPLFGEGVEAAPTSTPEPTAPATPSPDASAARKAAAREQRREQQRARDDERDAKAAAAPADTPGAPPPAAGLANAADTPSGGTGSWLRVGGILALVVVLGAAAGMSLRRRGTRSSSPGTAQSDQASAESR